MSILSRAAMADLPPMFRAQLEELDETLTAAAGAAVAAQQSAALAQQAANAALNQAWQASDDLLTALSSLPGDTAGVIEIIDGDTASVRPIDTDAQSLITKGNALIFAGRGATGVRPTIPSDCAAIYFDTTLGKPVFWNTLGWVDATGASV